MSQGVDVPIGDKVQFPQRFFWRCLLENDRVDELEILLVGHLIGELRILSQHISCQIIVPELAVEKKQIAECFRQERWVLKKEVELLERTVGVLVDVHQGLIEESH